MNLRFCVISLRLLTTVFIVCVELSAVQAKHVVTSDWNDASEETLRRAHVKALHSLTQALRFMWRNHQTLNLDAVIGTRIVEGILSHFLVFSYLITLKIYNFILESNISINRNNIYMDFTSMAFLHRSISS